MFFTPSEADGPYPYELPGFVSVPAKRDIKVVPQCCFFEDFES